MQALQNVLLTISAILGAWLMIMLVYQMVLTIFGFRKKTKDYVDHEPEARFLVMVPAHNEEKVIGDIIENLQRMDYPREMYDFYIIADNCTDGTAQVARAAGAKVIETRKESPDAPTGKPIALKKALEQVGEYEKDYDLLMIFDADNLMETNMFREVNSQYLDKGKPDFIQCYLGSKNKQGAIAWFYYTSYTITNRFFQEAKYRLGLNCSIGGTGFAMSTAYLRARGGWTTMSLTEDFEIQVEATLDGRRILWNHNTRVYDEKPTRARASFRQKTRWAQGHWFVALRNTFKVFGALLRGRVSVWEALSLITYMYSLSTYIIAIVQLVISLVLLLPGFSYKAAGTSWQSLCSGLVLFLYSYFMLFYVADWMDNRERFRFSTVPLMLWSIAVNTVIAAASQVWGFLCHRRQHTWVKTEHSIGRETVERSRMLVETPADVTAESDAEEPERVERMRSEA